MNSLNKKSFISLMLCFQCYSLESQENNLAEIKISNSKGVPEYIIKEVITIAKSAGEIQIAISSKQRTVRKQVEVMLDYYITCEQVSDIQQKEKCGINLVKNVYDIECHAGFSEYNRFATREINVDRMTKALTISLVELGEERVCMNHVVIPEINTKIIAVDIKPSSITNHKLFYQAVKNNQKVVQFYYPEIDGVVKSDVKDAAFHIGFYRQ